MAGTAPTDGPVGVYPGSFDPPTVAHVHLAEQAVAQLGLARLDLVISHDTLGKDDDALTPDRRAGRRAGPPGRGPAVAHRRHHATPPGGRHRRGVRRRGDRGRQVAPAPRPRLVRRLAGRDTALRRLPTVALAPRPPWALPGEDPSADPPEGVEVVVLDTDPGPPRGVGHRRAGGPARVAGRAPARSAVAPDHPESDRPTLIGGPGRRDFTGAGAGGRPVGDPWPSTHPRTSSPPPRHPSPATADVGPSCSSSWSAWCCCSSAGSPSSPRPATATRRPRPTSPRGSARRSTRPDPDPSSPSPTPPASPTTSRPRPPGSSPSSSSATRTAPTCARSA